MCLPLVPILRHTKSVGALPCPYVPTTGPYPESHETSPHPSILYHLDSLQCHVTIASHSFINLPLTLYVLRIQIPLLSKLLEAYSSICAWVSCSFFPSGLTNLILCAFFLLPVLIIKFSSACGYFFPHGSQCVFHSAPFFSACLSLWASVWVGLQVSHLCKAACGAIVFVFWSLYFYSFLWVLTCLHVHICTYLHTDNVPEVILNPLMPELNPSVQCCLPRFYTGDFNF
jgi:hypothetical protein